MPVVAGSALLADVEHACMEAQRIGFPLMLKSDAGGGGIGMALCRNEDALRGEFARVARLAGAHFGDASVFLERYVEHARHIEIQIFGDGRGAVATLGERDCSCQRRNQKVVEERLRRICRNRCDTPCARPRCDSVAQSHIAPRARSSSSTTCRVKHSTSSR